jgi:hypothetical protein
MSLQSVVDYRMSDEGGNQLNITIHGEEGDLILPAHVNVHLFDCKPGSITAMGGDNSIFLTRCTASGTINQADGSFIAIESILNSEATFSKSNRSEIKTTTVLKDLIFEDNARGELYKCKWAGGGQNGILAKGKSRVKVSGGTIRSRTYGVVAESGAFVDLNNVTLKTDNGVKAIDNAMVRMVGGENLAPKVAFEANHSQLYVSQLWSPLVATVCHLRAENRSKVHTEAVDFSPTAAAGIFGSDSTIEIINFNDLKAIGNTVWVSNCEVNLITGKVVESLEGKAIFAINKSRVKSIGVQVTKATTNDAVHVDASKYTNSVANEIRTVNGVALRGTNEATISVKKANLIQSTAAEICVLDMDSRAWLADIVVGRSISGNLMKLTRDSDVSIQTSGTFLSEGGHGIMADSNSTVQLQRLVSIRAMKGSAIKASKNSNVNAIYVMLIESLTSWGIEAADNCDVTVHRSTAVKGLLGGISKTAGGDADLELIDEITSTGPSLFINGGNVKLTKVGLKNTFELFQASADLKSTKVEQFLKATGATVNAEGCTFQNMDINESTLDIETSSLQYALIRGGSAIKSRLTTGDGLVLEGSSADLMGGAFTSIALDQPSSMISMNCQTTVSGLGNVIALGGGVVNNGVNRIEMQTGTIFTKAGA